jgi:hypothetical protein
MLLLLVYKWNHVPGYSGKPLPEDDGIEHIFIHDFADINVSGTELEEVIRQYGRKFQMLSIDHNAGALSKHCLAVLLPSFRLCSWWTTLYGLLWSKCTETGQ